MQLQDMGEELGPEAPPAVLEEQGVWVSACRMGAGRSRACSGHNDPGVGQV